MLELSFLHSNTYHPPALFPNLNIFYYCTREIFAENMIQLQYFTPTRIGAVCFNKIPQFFPTLNPLSFSNISQKAILYRFSDFARSNTKIDHVLRDQSQFMTAVQIRNRKDYFLRIERSKFLIVKREKGSPAYIYLQHDGKYVIIMRKLSGEFVLSLLASIPVGFSPPVHSICA